MPSESPSDHEPEPQPAVGDPQVAGEPAGAAPPTASVEPAEPDHAVLRWRRVARVMVGLEALAPLAAAVYGVVQLVTSSAVVARNEVMLVLLLTAMGLALAFCAYALGRGRSGVRTATLVWQVLLVLALVPAMWQAGQQALAVVVLAFAFVTGLATVRATPPTAFV